MDNQTEIQGIIEKLRRKGWSVSAIGRGMGVHYMTIWRWMSGSREPENLTAVTMALKQLLRKPIPERPYRKAS